MISGYGIGGYKPNSTVTRLINALPGAEIIVFHGSWCRDCVRSVPRLNRILKNVTTLQLTSVPVGHDKRDSAGIAEEHNLREIPMVVLRDGSRSCSIYSDERRWEEKILQCLMGFFSVEEDDFEDILKYGYDEL